MKEIIEIETYVNTEDSKYFNNFPEIFCKIKINFTTKQEDYSLMISSLEIENIYDLDNERNINFEDLSLDSQENLIEQCREEIENLITDFQNETKNDKLLDNAYEDWNNDTLSEEM